MTTDLFASLAGMVEQSQLAYVLEDEKNSINRARLINGDPGLAKTPDLNKTIHYLGGIGLSTENLPEEILSKGVIKATENNEWCVFPELEVVILASVRFRRYYGEVDGKKGVLLCGTNQDGFNAVGWSGTDCKACPFSNKNAQQAEKDKGNVCKSYLGALIYIPSLDHVAIFSGGGSSYMPTTEWFDQVSVLSKALAKKPEFQQANPGLARVNPYFFKTTLKPSEYRTNDSGKIFQVLQYSKAEQPYDWGKLLNDMATIKRAGELMGDLREVWEQMYVQPNTSAKFYGMALPGGQPAQALPQQSSAERVTVPALPAATQPAPAAPAPAVTPAMPAQPAQAAMASPALEVNSIALDDVDSVPPIGEVMTF